MTEYVRPEIPHQLFRDGDGAVINYGRRWGRGSPPDDAYSVTSNLERYAPLHVIAEALIAWLVKTYDASAVEDVALVEASRAHKVGALRAVTVTPSDERAAPLSFVFTDFPGLVIHAGVLYEDRMPSCGCDACDEGVSDVAEELEHKVLAVMAGGFSERVYGRVQVKIAHSLQLPGVGGWGGEGVAPAHLGREALRAARKRLAQIGEWQEWPKRRVT